MGGTDEPVVSEGMPGTKNILGGFEAGSAVKVKLDSSVLEEITNKL